MGPIFTIVSSVTVLIELLKSLLTHLLHCVQHSPQDSVIKIKSVQQPTDSERGDLIPSTLPPDAQDIQLCPIPHTSSVATLQKSK